MSALPCFAARGLAFVTHAVSPAAAGHAVSPVAAQHAVSLAAAEHAVNPAAAEHAASPVAAEQAAASVAAQHAGHAQTSQGAAADASSGWQDQQLLVMLQQMLNRQALVKRSLWPPLIVHQFGVG